MESNSFVNFSKDAISGSSNSQCRRHVLLHSVELCVSDLRTALERVAREEVKLRDAKTEDQRDKIREKVEKMRVTLKKQKLLSEFAACDTEQKKEEYLKELDKRKREKFLRQLNDLVHWDGTKRFSKVDAELKR